MLTPQILIDRRALLGAAAVSGAALAVGVPPAIANPRRLDPTAAPRVLSAAGRPGSVQRPGFLVHHLGLSWSGPEQAGRVRVRYADGWRSWQPLTASDSADDRRRSLAYVGAATAYEVEPADGVTGLRVHAINTVDGPDLDTPRDRVRQWTGLTYLSRAGWGADESLRFEADGTEKFPPAFFDVQTLTVHHTVTLNSDPDPAATVRAIYFLHCITEDFGDIGYHLLIDRAGTVYEGRYSGPDPLPVFGPRAVGPRPSMVTGAHIGGWNSGNVGVALLGDLTGVQPTAAARASLVRVLAALARVTDRDPLGTTSYVNPVNGTTKTVRTIAGHRDWAPTECPGEMFYPTLPQLREEVAAAL